MRIITIGREFGSGGRELGKRLADALGVPCYDKEIIGEAAKMQGTSLENVEEISHTDVCHVYTGTVGRSFGSSFYVNQTAINLLVEQANVIKTLAEKGDCVIVGRQADILLEEMNPLNLFVYADMQSKVKRCMQNAEEGETERKILQKIKRIDKSRAANRRVMGGDSWGKKKNYHLCINTSGMEIKTLVPALVEYVKAWFEKTE